MMDMPFIPVGSFRPDVAPYETGFSDRSENVIPSSQIGSRIIYSPAQSFEPFTNPIESHPVGVFSFTNSTDRGFIFAGTPDKLFKIEAGASAFSNVSLISAYATDDRGWWSFTSFGDIVIATNGANQIQYYDTSAAGPITFDNLSAGAPYGRYIATVREWVVVANTWDQIDGTRPQRVWWSALGDPFNWPTPGTLQSDYQDILGTQGQITGIVPNLANADAAIFFERGIYRMMFAQYPYVFTFDAVEGARGTLAPKSIVPVGNLVYYFGEDGFYVFDGIQSQSIGNQKIDEWFIKGLNKTYFYKIIGTADPERKLIYWAFPSNNSSSGQPDRILVYNYAIGEWSYIIQDTSFLFISETFPVTLEDLDELYPNLEAIPYSLDSTLFAGGSKRLSYFSHDNRMGYQGTNNLRAVMESGQFHPKGNKRGLITNSRVILDGYDTEFSVAIGYRDEMIQNITWNPPVSPRPSGYIPQRKDSRFFKMRVEINEGSRWNTFQGFEVAWGDGVSTR